MIARIARQHHRFEAAGTPLVYPERAPAFLGQFEAEDAKDVVS
jgi:hypothetical protein